MGWFSKGDKDDQPAQSPAAGPPTPAASPPSPPQVHRQEPPVSAASPEPVRATETEAARPASSLASVFQSALGAAPRAAEPPVAAPVRLADGGSVFAESADIEGSLEGDGDVLLRGRVHGSITITGTLQVAETGRVQADVTAREVVNAGTVEGNIHASERVRVQATGLVQGNIDAPSVIIDDGGGVEGFVQMGTPPGEDDDFDERSEPQPRKSAGLLRRSGPAPGPGMGATTPASGAGAPTPAGQQLPHAGSHPAPLASPPAALQAAPRPWEEGTAPASASPQAAGHAASGPALPPPGPRPAAAGLLFRPAAQPASTPAVAPLPAAGVASAAGALTTPGLPTGGNGASRGNGGAKEAAGSQDPFGDLTSESPAQPVEDDSPIL